MLETVLQYGTAKDAALEGQFAAGKTGTTTNYADAWFVGWDSRYTVAVWVGYPNKLVPMTTQYGGSPVLGGTFPALIWHDFMVAASQIAAAKTHGRLRLGGHGKPGRSARNGWHGPGLPARDAPPRPRAPRPPPPYRLRKARRAPLNTPKRRPKARRKLPKNSASKNRTGAEPKPHGASTPPLRRPPPKPRDAETPAAKTEVPASRTPENAEPGNAGGAAPSTGGTATPGG